MFKIMFQIINNNNASFFVVYLVGSGLRFSMDGIKFRPETTDITFNDVKGVSNSFLKF